MVGGDGFKGALELGVGLDGVHLAGLVQASETIPFVPHSSWSANSTFFTVSLIGRMRFSTTFLSSLTGLLCRKASSPSHWLAM